MKEGNEQSAGKSQQKKNTKVPKAVNANSLLGFEIDKESKSKMMSMYVDHRKSYGGSNAINKEKYLQSNFKFIVNQLANYEDLALNSSKLIDWNTVELVLKFQ